MSIGLYMDVHIPKAITIGLRLRGVDVLTAQEDGAITLPDADLLDSSDDAWQNFIFARRRFIIRSSRPSIAWQRFCGRYLLASIDKSDWALHRRFRNNR